MARYVSAFAAWDRLAWVRSKRHHATTGFSEELDFFPRSLAITLRSPDTLAPADPDIEQALLVEELYGYLTYTLHLELGLVSVACRDAATDPVTTRADALLRRDFIRAFADEGGHAEMCEDLMLAVEAFTGVRRRWRRPAFLRRLEELEAGARADVRPLVSFLAAVVSETVASPVLINLPTDERVQPAVRGLFRDHVLDETRHAALFRFAFRRFWPRLPASVRATAAELLPAITDALVGPDEEWVTSVLSRYPDAFPDPRGTAEDLAHRQWAALAETDTLRPLLTLLDETGVLDHGGIAEAFSPRVAIS